MTSFIAFIILALYDGLYLHLVRFRLYDHSESKYEHKTHTFKALIFPMILYFFYLGQGLLFFYIGLLFVVLDIIALTIDAYSEKDSREFMGGLPRWEYIIHLFVNGFHFVTIAVFLILKINISSNGWIIKEQFDNISSYNFFTNFVLILIPGAILLGLLHLFLNFEKPRKSWDKLLDSLSKPRESKSS